MSKEKKKHSLSGEYDKIRIVGNPGYGRKDEAYIYITVKDVAYTCEIASQSFTIKEAKEIVGLLEAAIKEATKKEKN